MAESNLGHGFAVPALPATPAERLVDAVQREAITREDIMVQANLLSHEGYPVAQTLQALVADFSSRSGECRTVRGFCKVLHRDFPLVLETICAKLLDQKVVAQVASEAQSARAEQRAWARSRQQRVSVDEDERYER